MKIQKVYINIKMKILKVAMYKMTKTQKVCIKR